MDIRQAAEKALKALEVQWHLTNGNKQIGGAIDALRAALSAALPQEPADPMDWARRPIMNQILDDCWQQNIASSIERHAAFASDSIQRAAGEYERPSVLWRPSISLDGNQWCALYGANLQDGVAGFGDSPAEAMRDFDRAWYAKHTGQGGGE